MIKKLTTEEFIKRSKLVHGNKYDYSLVDYEHSHKKVKIICPEHGVFEQRANSHLSGQKCRKCKNDGVRKRLDEFIIESKKIHGDKYDYSLSKYINCFTKMDIICPKHGIFKQSPLNHLIGGCKECGKEKMRLNQFEFIERSKKIHKNKYDYSLVEYKLSRMKIKIICPNHGIFEQTVNSHLSGQGCIKCYKENQKMNINEFLRRAKKIHGDKYDYSLVEYKNNYTRVEIICPIHGIFKQSPDSHLRNETNCPTCKSKSKSEMKIYNYLKLNDIVFETQKTFDDCKFKNKLRFDFYIPEHNTCIEYDGEQHNISIKYWGGENGFKYRKNNDKIKDEYCKNNNIRLIRINNKKIEEIEKILNNFKS